MEILMLFLLIITTFIMAVKIPKKLKSKIIAVVVWIFAWFGDMVISEILFEYYAKKYAKISIYEKGDVGSLYIGNFDILMKPKIKQNSNTTAYNNSFAPFPNEKIIYPTMSSPYLLNSEISSLDRNFKMLINGDLKYIDYKERSNHPINNGKYFRIYLDINNSKNCFMSPNNDIQTIFSYDNLSYNELLNLYKKYYDGNFSYKFFINYEIDFSKISKNQKELIEILLNLGFSKYDMEELIKFNFINIEKSIIFIRNLYQNKCIARKEIDKSEISRYEFKSCYDANYGLVCDKKESDMGFLADLFGAGLGYTGIIKKDGKIVAERTYLYYSHKSFVLGFLNKIITPEASGTFRLFNGCGSFDKCNQILMDEFLEKDKK